MFKFELNQIVKDSITNFQGQITARVEYSSDQTQYYVENEQNERWVAENRLEVVKAEAEEDVSDISL